MYSIRIKNKRKVSRLKNNNKCLNVNKGKQCPPDLKKEYNIWNHNASDLNMELI